MCLSGDNFYVVQLIILWIGNTVEVVHYSGYVDVSIVNLTYDLFIKHVYIATVPGSISVRHIL
jgi:hypothetical protein